MIVLHASVCGDKLLLWGEVASSESAGNEAKRRFTFDAGWHRLEATLAQLGCHGHFKQHLCSATLPTVRGKALASSGLIDPSFDPAAPAKLGRWSVAALELTPATLVQLITLACERNPLATGVVAGEDFRYLQDVYIFANGLMLRQRYLPGVRLRDQWWYSVWEPLIGGDDLDRFSQLVAAAPDSVRSLSFKDVLKISQNSGLQAVHELVGMFVNYGVREAAQSLPSVAYSGKGAHDQWLNALGSDQPLQLKTTELNSLISDLARWKRPVNSTLNAAFRLCFRLEEPETFTPGEQESIDSDFHHAAWRLTYLLQSNADPSLFIDANSIWSGGETSALNWSTTAGAREYLLASLGAASMIYPRVETSLLSADPSFVQIDVGEAYEFMIEQAAVLRQAGFGVLLPAWWTQKRARPKAKAKVTSKIQAGKAKLSLESLMQVEWEVVIGDQVISLEELEQLAALKIPLVRIRGQWVELGPEQIQQAIAFLKRTRQSISMRQLVRLRLGLEELPSRLGFDGIEGSGVAGDFLRTISSDEEFEELDPVSTFEGQLRPYQKRGFSWLYYLSRFGIGPCLADDMGLGKTVQTLAFLQKLAHENEDVKPSLLICPMSVVGNWQREAQRFTPDLKVMIHHGSSRKKGAEFAAESKRHALVISSYGLLVRDQANFDQLGWEVVILDEAQNIKNPFTKLAKVARGLKAQTKLALTGTPVENTVGDLWSIMEFLNPGLLGDRTSFRKNFLLPIQVERDVVAIDQLKKITSPFVLRRLKTDSSIIKDLPEKLEMTVFCNLTREQASLYSAAIKDMERLLEEAEGIERKGLVLSLLMKLKQICNHPTQFLHDQSALDNRSGKLSRLTEMVDELLQAGDHALIFSQFAEMGDLIKTHLQNTFGQEVLFLHGALSKDKRDKMVARFQEEQDGPRLFVLSLKAGGVGLNLTRANHVFHFDRWWNPAVEDQATDRAFRIGQKRQVQVHKFVCTGTLEEKIDEIIRDKQSLSKAVVSQGEAMLTELSNSQLREFIKLGKDAVAE